MMLKRLSAIACSTRCPLMLACALAATLLGPAAFAKAMGDGHYVQTGGKVVMEVEHAPPAGDWNAETNHAGFTGSSFYAWRGPDLFNSPGSGILEYPFMIVSGGTHYLKIHNRRDQEGTNAANDQYNDIWVKIDSGPWQKVFSDHLPWSEWNWTSKFDVHNVWPPATYNLGTGLHTMYISGRSARFKIDRIQLTLNSNATPSTSEPISPWDTGTGGGPDPEIDSLTLVNADTDADIRTLSNGATIDLQVDGAALNIRADPVDSVGSIEFFLNGDSIKMENIAPYAMGGDVAGDYDVYDFEIGNHTLTVIPYSGGNGSGTAGVPYVIDFAVVNDVACAADTDGDNTVDTNDMLNVLDNWGTCAGPCDSDTNDDGFVDITDLLNVLHEWGPCT